MAIARWSPVTDLMSLHSAMDRLFNDVITPARRGRGDEDQSEGYVPLDVYQTDKEWVIRAAVPSVDPNQIDVSCDGNTIRIQGEIREPKETRSENYWMRENFYGRFLRQVTLPESSICDQTKAEFRNGMLELKVPKRQPSQPEAKKIPVTAASGNGSTAGGTGSTTAQSGDGKGQTGTPQGQTTQGQTNVTSGQSAKERELQGTNRK
jgi:HSP20 family protein